MVQNLNIKKHVPETYLLISWLRQKSALSSVLRMTCYPARASLGVVLPRCNVIDSSFLLGSLAAFECQIIGIRNKTPYMALCGNICGTLYGVVMVA